MHPYGGTPICPRCSKAVYAAEQVMGPGRKLYHKPCLSCMECNKRLDSYNLVEHDQEPYCKNCHTKLFGTRDLRQANLPHRDGAAPLSPTRTGSFQLPNVQSPANTGSPRSSVDGPPLPPRTTRSPPPLPGRHNNSGSFSLKPTHSLSPTANSFSSSIGRPTSPPGSGHFNSVAEYEEDDDNAVMDNTSELESSDRENSLQPLSRTGIPNRTVSAESPLQQRQFQTASPGTVGRAQSSIGGTMSMKFNGSATLGRGTMSPLTTSPTGTRYGVGLTGELKPMQTGGRWGAETPKCPKCGKSVYFAEQVKAVGKTWHKGCLRCGECNTTLDSSRLTEKDGEPFCSRCYNKLHGPRGGGYALLGKAGG
ncbi:LIM-domain-containing protein [Stereum hirsutum FP-91666 SS1]|uniref:Cysteine-rich protein 1 n=1 Tax=Stereum hirsutum (strain FP-91666) TaxID=721885 RepID=R7RZ73_STEHR|nr:LIM-domain-containing protein [Stereum hirsutum FP-91666 SS1]EIM80133.1 LIM-domain-containing protein [Stereum hirsutum FP-91666 SS1]